MEINTLEAKINDYYESESIVYYTISLYHTPSRTSWHVSRRFSEFEGLFNTLNEQFLEIPSLPSKLF
jgi:PX domain.